MQREKDLPGPSSTLPSWKSYFRQSLELAVIMFASLGGYLTVLKWRGQAARWETWTPWDDWFPYQPAWVWVYLLPYLIGPLLIGFLQRGTFLWYVRRGLSVVVITLVIFILLPTQTAARPGQHDLTGFTAWIYDKMIEIDDPPANAAPSLHVSLTFLLAMALWLDFPRWWPVILAGVGLVWLATLLTRQHHLIDVVTGVALALAVVWLLRVKQPQSHDKT